VKKTLNKEQLAAIKHKTGPLLVIAGAGTGKTTVITERVKYLIEKKLAKPQEILALTFTEKAAREMEERVDIALAYGLTNMWIMTFHSFCERILRQNALHIGLDPRFKLTSEAETVQRIRDNLFSFKLNYFRPLSTPNKFIGGMIQHFSRLQDENISPIDYVSWATRKTKQKKQTQEQKIEHRKWLELANAYKTYEELKIKNGLMDFGDLITKTIKLFRERPNILEEYRQQFKYILIDEFQDTNFAQNELAILLTNPKTQNINVVGDDDQSVYRFRGAAVSNIIQFRKNFPKTKVIVLTKNYRSTQEILDRSYDLIQHNNPDRLEVVEKIDKKLISERKVQGELVKFIHVDRVENEAEEVVKEIKSKKNKYEWKDFAILVRANNHAEPFSRALSRQGIPYQFLGPGRLFKQSEIIDLISYLKVLYNFDDSMSLYRILTMSIFNLNARDIAKLGNNARKYNTSLFEVMEKADELEISDESKVKIKNIVEMIHKHLGLISKESPGQILYYFLEHTELLKDLANPETKVAEKKANNISKFFDKLKTFETDHPDANLFNVVDWLELSSELGESPLATDSDWGNVNAVNILTVHSAKGLEFPVVFLVNLVSQRFPTIERREQIPIPEELIKEILPTGDYHLEEERRLFYVGMTRAKERLCLTASNYYGEGKRDKKLSPFILESLGDLVEQEKQKNKTEEQLSFLDYGNKEIEEKVENKTLKVDYLSYSQIETFKVCPLHYKLKYILKLPSLPTASLSFGISIHNTLKDFYELIKKSENPDERVILKLLKNNWIHEGYTNKIHEEKFLEKGKMILKGFLKKNPPTKILGQAKFLEESFLIPISKDIKIGGKIDRVDELSDGTYEIWDYKTGANVSTKKIVDKDLQLTIYAMAMAEMGIKLENVKLSLYYLETQTKITTTRTESQIMKAKEEILKIKEEIEKSDFKCTGNFLCQNCEFKLFCKTQDE
jgi:DNA helicase-2/ATP-dependent DNA helicase PcrA